MQPAIHIDNSTVHVTITHPDASAMTPQQATAADIAIERLFGDILDTLRKGKPHPLAPDRSPPSIQPHRVKSPCDASVDGANFDAAVFDPATNLMWAGDTLPERKTWAEADAACKALTLCGHTDWRLPTREELVSLVDYNRQDPAINTELFPDTKSGYYWSSSPAASDPDVAWIVHFYYGSVYLSHRDDEAVVRAVRSVPASQ